MIKGKEKKKLSLFTRWTNHEHKHQEAENDASQKKNTTIKTSKKKKRKEKMISHTLALRVLQQK